MRKVIIGLLLTMLMGLFAVPVMADSITANFNVLISSASAEGPFQIIIEGEPKADSDVFLLKRSQKREVSILITEPGNYTYYVSQTQGTDDRINYDSTVYKVDVFVTSNDAGTLSIPAINIYEQGSTAKLRHCSFSSPWKDVISKEDRDAANTVADLIDSLPDPEYVMYYDEDQVNVAKDAYEDLTDAQKELIPESKKRLDEIEAALVADMINNLPYPIVTADELDDLLAVKDAYNKLSDEQKDMIKDAKERLDLVEVSVLVAVINALPVPGTAEDLEDPIYKVKGYFNDLSDEQKAMIPNSKSRLDESESTAVADLIDHLPPADLISFDDRDTIMYAKNAFDILSSEQQEMIPVAKAKLEAVLAALTRKDKNIADTVMDLINKLPDPKDATADDYDLVSIAKEAYGQLTPEQKSLIQDAKNKLDAVEVAVVKDMINKLPDPKDAGSEHRPAVDKAKNAYNDLTDAQKSELTTEKARLDAVDTAVAEAEQIDRNAAAIVEDMINALPNPEDADASHRPAVNEAKEAYENLTDNQKALIQEAKERLDAIDTVVSIDEMDGEEKAQAVAELIANLPDPENATSSDRLAVDTAKAAYNKLTSIQKSLIPEAKERLDAVDAAVREAERKDRIASDIVASMIDALPDPKYATADDREQVVKAKEAYEKLSDNQKALIEKEKEKLDAVDLAVVEDMIYQLPEPKDATKEDKPAVEKARKAFDELTSEQQDSIPEMKKKLEEVEIAIVQNMIDQIPVPTTAENYTDVFEAKEAYEKLNDEQKEQIKGIDKLYENELNAVKDMIHKLPDPKDATIQDRPDVDKAKTAYNNLSDRHKSLIPNEKEKLDAVEEAVIKAEEKDNKEGDRVVRMIDDLPDPDRIKTSDKDDVYEAKDAFNALSNTQKNRIAESKKRLDDIEVALVKALISALPDPVTAKDLKQVKEVNDAYNKLSKEQRSQMTDYLEKLKEAQKQLFKAMVNALPDPKDATSLDREAVETAKNVYNDLSDDVKQEVITEKDKLDAVDEAVTNAEEHDRKAAQKVADLINDLPDPEDATADDRTNVNKAIDAYNDLTDYQKTLIVEEKARLDAIDAMVKIAEQVDENQVAEMIRDLPNPEDATVYDRAEVDAVKTAYDHLTDSQKLKIPREKERLDAIDQAVRELENNSKQKANAVKELINNLPSPAKAADLNAVKNVIHEYKKLNDYEKGLISEEAKALNQAIREVMKDMIDNLPSVDEISADDWDKIERVRNFYDSLSDEQKALLSDLKDLLDALEVAAIKDMINRLPANPTSTDLDQYLKVKDAYESLSESQKNKLKNEKKELDSIGVEIVRDMINKLPDPENATALDKPDVDLAKETYNGLSSSQKGELKTEKKRLDEIDAVVRAAEVEDQREAQAVADLIKALPNPEDATSADRSAVDTAKVAYNNLTQTQKNLITEEKSRLDEIDMAVSQAEARDWEAVQDLIKMIDALPDPENASEDDRTAVDEAYHVYDKLTENQQALIIDYKKKLDAVDAMVTLDEQNGKAKAVADMINELPDPEDATSADRGAVDAVKEAYEQLSDNQKKSIANEKVRLDEIDAAVSNAEARDWQLAEQVEDMINNLPNPENAKSTDRAAVDKARLAYDTLTYYQQSLIENAKERLQLIEEAVARAEALDLSAAYAVAALIDALPSPEFATVSDRSAVDVAKAAYNKLTETQKALIPEYKKKLDSVDAAVRALENDKNSNGGNTISVKTGTNAIYDAENGTKSSDSDMQVKTSKDELKDVKTGDTNPVLVLTFMMIGALGVLVAMRKAKE